jgi:hypothetical protein
MNCKDKKDGLSREGCGRVALYKATGNPLCYTLECNYASGKLKNTISPKMIKATGQIEPETDPVTDANSLIYADKSAPAPPYTIEIFEDLGRAFCISLLDYVDKNPISRIPTTTYKNLDAIKAEVINTHKILIPKKPALQNKQNFGAMIRANILNNKKPSSSQPRSQSLRNQKGTTDIVAPKKIPNEGS